MGPRLATALTLAVLLIGVASWHRFSKTEYVQPNIIALGNNGQQIGFENENFLNDFLAKSTTTNIAQPDVSGVANEKLTNTDIIGQGLLSNYIYLASNGQATDANVEALVSNYVEKIPTLLEVKLAEYADIKVVSDTRENLESYALGFAKIHIRHSSQINQIFAGNSGSSNPTDYYESAGEAVVVYENEVSELKNLPVPQVLALTHLDLINNQISNAVASRAFMQNEIDPVSGFAGMIKLNDNLDKEISIIKKIGEILKSNGI